MRERAELVGASLQVGPTDAGGWTVSLRLGREALPTPAPPATTAQPDPTEGPR